MIELRPDNVVFHPNGLVMEVDTPVDAFTLTALAGGLGVLLFTRVSDKHFRATQWLAAHSPDLYPPASVRGVLWQRQAAIEADQAIAAYQAGAGLTPAPGAQLAA